MRRNLLVTTWYTGLGGGETALLTLMDALDANRYAPRLLAPREGQLPDAFRKRGWPVQIVPFRGVSSWFIPALSTRAPVVSRIAGVLREQAIDVVYADYHSLPFALSAARCVGIPITWICWGWWFRPHLWQRSFFRQPDAAFAASWAIREGFLGQPPFMSPEALPVLPPGVDSTRFRPDVDGSVVRRTFGIAADAPLVSMLARFQDVKGHDTFQDMALRVLQYRPDAHFLVAGENVHGKSADDAYKRRILERWQSEPPLRERLQYIGFRSDTEHIIAASDVIVCASHFESFGVVHLETMSSGKPIVSTRRGGPAETVVDGLTGFLVDPKDAAALAERVVTLLGDASLRQRMGQAGRARVLEHYDAQRSADRFMAALDHVTAALQRYNERE
jgi:glycosyltransferase involved in cell wall biosynthesis